MAYDLTSLDDRDLPRVQRPITGVDLLVQRLTIKLSTFRGEVQRDAALGLPYLEWMQIRPFPRVTVRQTLTAAIRQTPGVGSVSGIVDDYDPQRGTYDYRCDVAPDGDDPTIRLSIGNRGPDGNQVPWAVIILYPLGGT